MSDEHTPIAPIEEDYEQEQASELDEFTNTPVGEYQVPDPTAVITIQSQYGNRYFPVTEGQIVTANEVIIGAGVSFVGQYQIWMNGAVIRGTDVVPAGSTLNVVGSQKGG